MSELKSLPLWQWRLLVRFARLVHIRPDDAGRYVIEVRLLLAGHGLLADSQGRAVRFDTFEAACAFAHRHGIAMVSVPTFPVARLHTARETTQSILSDIRGGLL